MTSALQTQKLDRSFAHLDVDGNGSVTREDLRGLGARLLVGFGEMPTSERGKSIMDQFDALWSSLAAAIDADGDQRLSPEEFRTGMTDAFIHGAEFDRTFHPAAQAIAELMDTDGDNRVSRDEFRIMHEAFGASQLATEEAFSRLDRDSSGELTVDELVVAVRQYYTGDDPDAVGNWLFGSLE